MTAKVIPFKRPDVPAPTCSFCKRTEKEVLKLFGNGLTGGAFRSICNDCAQFAKQRIEETEP